MKTAQAIVRPAGQIIPTDYQCWYLCCLITMALFGHSKNIFFYQKKIKTNKKYIQDEASHSNLIYSDSFGKSKVVQPELPVNTLTLHFLEDDEA